MVLSAGMSGLQAKSNLRPMIVPGKNAGDKMPTSLKESLGHLKKNSYLQDVMGPELNKAYIAVREQDAASKESIE